MEVPLVITVHLGLVACFVILWKIGFQDTWTLVIFQQIPPLQSFIQYGLKVAKEVDCIHVICALSLRHSTLPSLLCSLFLLSKWRLWPARPSPLIWRATTPSTLSRQRSRFSLVIWFGAKLRVGDLDLGKNYKLQILIWGQNHSWGLIWMTTSTLGVLICSGSRSWFSSRFCSWLRF